MSRLLLLLFSCSVMTDSLLPYGLCPARLLYAWDFPDRNTGVNCHFLFQGIFLTQGLNLYLLHWQVDSFPLRHQGSPQNIALLGPSGIQTQDLLFTRQVLSQLSHRANHNVM